MVYKIVVKKRFQNKYIALLDHLGKEFGLPVALRFQRIIFKRFERLKHFPYMGISSETIPGVRSILLSKQNRIYYKIESNKIVILNMYDTRMNPKRNPYKK